MHPQMSYASIAPRGFGFVPAGHPEFAEWCKEQCRQRNLDVHIVSVRTHPLSRVSQEVQNKPCQEVEICGVKRFHGTGGSRKGVSLFRADPVYCAPLAQLEEKHPYIESMLTFQQAKPRNRMFTDPEKLSAHVHRVGYHFPDEIISLACSKFGYVYDEARGLREDKSGAARTNWIAQSIEDYSTRQAAHGRPATQRGDKEQTRGAVREMFPKIPEVDLHAIINHAFEQGTNRVGNADLPLARRVQLAVVAHIRHVYTDYDKLLKTGGWSEARAMVEPVSLAKLKEWRDEAGAPSNEIEDTFREVIVLDDDDESSDESSLSTPDEREQSMEIVSSRATARDLEIERRTDYPHMDVQTMRRVPKRTIVVQSYPPQPAHLASPSQRQPTVQQGSAQRRPLLPPYEYHPSPHTELYQAAHNRPVDQYDPAQCHIQHITHTYRRMRGQGAQLLARVSQPLMQQIDGRIYHVSVGMPCQRARQRYPHTLPPVELTPSARTCQRRPTDNVSSCAFAKWIRSTPAPS
jgi:hypothetical protein